MTTEKRGFLQRFRIVLMALTAILGIGGAMAMNGKGGQASQSYRYLSETSGHYIVEQTASTVGSYRCNVASTICTIQSDSAPVSDNGVFKLDKNSSSPTMGTYVNLD